MKYVSNDIYKNLVFTIMDWVYVLQIRMSVHLEAPISVNRRASTISVATRALASGATHWTLTGDDVTVSQKRKILADVLTYKLTD